MKTSLHTLGHKKNRMKVRSVSNAILLLVILSSIVLSSPKVASVFGLNDKQVVVIELDSVVNVAAVDLIKEGIDYAHNTGATAVVLLVDTPGGLLDATFEIIRLIDQSSVPVISFVYPRGAKALSAGVFIVLSSHVAVMEPYSIIGSAQPRAYPSGELIGDQKLINYLVGELELRARMHKRNETISAKFVTENLNVDAYTAKDYGITEAIASSLEELLAVVDGMSVQVAGEQEVILRTRYAQIHYFGPTIRVQVLRVISDPLIAYLLFILGVWGIIFGFLTLGFEGEIIGGILLILGLIGMGFYVDLFVITLLIIGGGLVYVEMREPGLQFFGPAGVFCLLVGSLLLLRLNPTQWLISPEWYWFFMAIVLMLTIILGGFSMIVLYKLFRTVKKRPSVLGFIGESGRTIDEIDPDHDGFVLFHGEHWKARSRTLIKAGQKIRIVAKEGLTLIVEPVIEDQN